MLRELAREAPPRALTARPYNVAMIAPESGLTSVSWDTEVAA
jgi:hypothetical protein